MMVDSEYVKIRKKKNRRFLITLGVIFSLLVLGASGAIYWLGLNNPTFFTAIGIFESISPVTLPSVPLTPSEEQITPEGTGDVDLALTDKLLVVPEKFREIKPFTVPRPLKMPPDATTNVFAADLEKIRFMAVSPSSWAAGGGILYATEQKPGRILAFPDRDGDGVADETIIVVAGLTNPHGIVFHNNALWVATEKKITKYFDFDGDMFPERSVVVIDNLPSGGNHVTRTIAFDKENRLYVSIGSSCNVCEEARSTSLGQARRGVVLRFDENGANEEVFATGTRNSVGITFGKDPWNPSEEALWATDNGRDLLGDDLPPDEVNVLREGKNYGYPYCYADGFPDYSFASVTDAGVPVGEFCKDTFGPVVSIQAHTAPLGLRFLDGNKIPSPLRGQLAIALHGSWNRTIPVGYEVIRVSGLTREGAGVPEPFVAPLLSGFMIGNKGWGRPVDVVVGGDGAIYISDDKAGAIYRMAFTQE